MFYSQSLQPIYIMQFTCEYPHDHDDAFLAMALASNADDTTSLSLSDYPSAPTSIAGTPRSPCAPSIPVAKKQEHEEKLDLTEHEENAENMNFLVSVWNFERLFLADHKARYPGPLSTNTRFEIKRDAFTAAELALSCIVPEGRTPQRSHNRSAREIRMHFRVLKPARRALAARLLA